MVAARAGPSELPPPCPGRPARAARIRLLIADDHAVVREGLVAMIGRQADMTVVAQADDGREAVDLWKQHRPDVALLDLRMPKLDGVGVIEEIRAQHGAARVILLTTFDSDEDIYRGLRAGAKAYLLKDARREVLLECIRKVQAGEMFVPPAIAAKLAERVREEELTRRETEVLALLAGGKTNKEIGQSLCITETTVKTHVKSLFAKLSVLNRTEAIAAASRRGLIHF
ncbi:MAG: response regulator transcription factor [Verrucomicrobia bacterium]|nr:response regulator transcription factor [Verrucomicrobiota bacterium]